GQPARKVVERVEERHRQLLEQSIAQLLIRHGAVSVNQKHCLLFPLFPSVEGRDSRKPRSRNKKPFGLVISFAGVTTGSVAGAERTQILRPQGNKTARAQLPIVRKLRRRRNHMAKYIVGTDSSDGLDRRGFLKCMAWAGTGAFCVIQGGVLKSFALGK